MAGWEDYNITGSNFGNRFPYPILDAFINALKEKFLAIFLSYGGSLSPTNWRAKFQSELNKVLPYYVPYYEDKQKVQEWQEFLENHGFFKGKNEQQKQELLENLCNTGILDVTPPGIFLARYAKMIYDLLNLMISIRADKISSCFKINCHYDTEGENIFDGVSEPFTDSGELNNQAFDTNCFCRFMVGYYTMKRSPQYSLTAEYLTIQWMTTTNSGVVLKFINPTYNRERKFSYTISGFFAGEDIYAKTKTMQIAWSGYKYPAWGGYKKIENDNTTVSTDETINGYCESTASQILVSTNLEYEGENLQEDTDLPPILDPYPELVYTSESGLPPAPYGSEPFVQDSNGNWYMPPNIQSAWTSDEAYIYQHTKSPTKPIFYAKPGFEFQS